MGQFDVFSRFGGLTLVAMPGFEEVGRELKKGIERYGRERNPTPTDLVVPAAAYGRLDRIVTFDFHCPQNTMAALLF